MPLKNDNESAIIVMTSLEKSVLVTLTLTEGNFLFENQCTRPDGKKVLMKIEDNTPKK